MARTICTMCDSKVSHKRSSHLREDHRIKTYRGAIRHYFLKPEEIGISRRTFNKFPEGHLVDRNRITYHLMGGEVLVGGWDEP